MGKQDTITEEEFNQEMMAEFAAEHKAQKEAEKKQWEEVETELRAMMGDAWWEEVIAHVTEDNEDALEEEYFNPRIQEKNYGTQFPLKSYKRLKHFWVHQTLNGGHLGDDFAGEIFYELSNGSFLAINYAM